MVADLNLKKKNGVKLRTSELIPTSGKAVAFPRGIIRGVEECAMATIDLEKVWYRSDVNRWRDLQFLAMQDSGILTVGELAFNYHGKKQDVCIFDIKSISLCKQGRDFVNTWVKIEYQADKTAYFADGGYLGWRGAFGGTRKIYQILCQNIPNMQPERTG